MTTDERFMKAALALAKRGVGATSPNPAVGAVVVERGRVVSRGWHKRAGGPHAEAAALAGLAEGGAGGAGGRARGKGPRLAEAVLYVTLEPCCHHGRTPPCTDAVISSGVRRVVVGALDPNPKVSGRGVGILRAAGIDVTTGVLAPECSSLNEAYNKYITTGLPFVTIKLATSLDGRIATATGESRWITGEAARRHVHRMRARSDAVMVGANTAAKDDPELTVRLSRGKDPLRVLVDTRFSTPLEARIFAPPAAGGPPPAIVFTTRAAGSAKVADARRLGIEVVLVRRSGPGVDLARVLAELGRREVTSLLVEGGGTLAASLVRASLADRLVVFTAPVLIGGDGVPCLGPAGVRSIADLRRLRDVTTRRAGEDIIIEGLF